MPPSEKPRVCPHCAHVLGAQETQVCTSCGGSLVTAARKKPGLLQRWGIPAAVGIVLIAACIFFDLTMNPHSVFKKIFRHREPVYQWVQSEDRTFSFLPGEGKAWGPFAPQEGKIHYLINSYLPVDTGLMDQAQWGEDTGAWSAMKKSSACYESKIRSSSKICPVASGKPQLIFVRDVRAKQIPLGGAPSDFAGKKTLQEQNSVTITVFAWKCMENCK